MLVSCGHSPSLVFKIDGIEYYGADQSHALGFGGELLFNFSGRPNIHQSILDIPELAQHLKIPFNEVLVPWPDMGVPCVSPDFWKSLHQYALKQHAHKVCFHCAAGHGRTGTALASMLIANLGYGVAGAVDEVRREYCELVVESFGQVEYLKLLDKHFNKAVWSELEIDGPLPSSFPKKVEMDEIDKYITKVLGGTNEDKIIFG